MFLRRFARSIAAATFAAVLLPFGPVSAATTITVCAVGCDHTTIGAAIAAASDGDTIDVGAGTYTENGLTIDKSLTIRGVPPAPAVGDPEDLLTPGVLQTVIQTGGPGNGPTFTLSSPLVGPAPEIRFEDLAIIGNDDFDTIRIQSNDPVRIQNLVFDGVSLTGSRTAINTAGLRPIHGLEVTNSAVTCTGASNPTGGILLGVADGIGEAVLIVGNYIAQCGWAINAGDHTGFGATSAVAGPSRISDNRMEENVFGCVLIAISYADLTISGNSFTDCDQVNSTFDGAINLQALAPATDVKVIGNAITRSGATTAGNVGVIIQNIPASPGNLARFLVEGNRITGMTATGTSDGIRLGPTIIARAPADIDIDIVGNTLTGNTRGMSWQTNAGNNLGLNLDVHRNRIAGNAARAISLFGTGRTLNATENWFGCNAGPSVGAPLTACDSIGVASGTSFVTFEPWITLGITAAPTTIGSNGDTSSITASLTTNSDGGVVANPIPDDTPIAFATDLGSVAPSSDGTSGGVAGTVLTSGAATGIATVTATLDAETVGASVVISGQLGKAAVLAAIEAAHPTGDKATDKHLEKAIDALQKSLAPELWIDGSHLTPKKGKKVFDEERRAVHELDKIKDAGALAGNIASWINSLVAVDRALAQTAIDEAPAGKEKDKAIDELAKGDAEAADDDFDKAIEHYGHAWSALKV